MTNFSAICHGHATEPACVKFFRINFWCLSVSNYGLVGYPWLLSLRSIKAVARFKHDDLVIALVVWVLSVGCDVAFRGDLAWPGRFMPFMIFGLRLSSW